MTTSKARVANRIATRAPGSPPPTAGHHHMQISEHITVIADEGASLAAAARRSGLDAVVPTCPGWTTRDLVRHLGLIHLWAASHVAHPHEQPALPNEAAQREFTAAFWPRLGVFWVDDADLVDWYLDTNTNLVAALEAAPADLKAWTFLPAPSPRAMWARRQAHETAVHRYDAESASGDTTGYDEAFAADGVDEILCGMTTQRRLDEPVTEQRAMLVHAHDTDDRWLVSFTDDVVSVVREDGLADVTVTAAASDLYLSLWNRIGDTQLLIEGNREVLDIWHRHFRVRWYQNG